MRAAPLLQVDDLSVDFKTGAGAVRALSGVSLSVDAGQTLGLVGESGCGKSITSLAILGLVPEPHGRISGGRILFAGEDLVCASAERLREIRGAGISIVFQEPMTSLNPVFTVGEQIAETVRRHSGMSRGAARRRAVEMLRMMQIPAPEARINAYPHQMSGGMRQRVMIAMALVCRPRLLIADEPTTALDVTVQAQIFALLRELQGETGCAIILITHDMGAVAQMADEVAVMYAGHIVERGAVDQVLDSPAHPYTRGLIACVPHLAAEDAGGPALLPEIPGMVPSPAEVGDGCPFAPRCAERMEMCERSLPEDIAFAPGREVKCFLHSHPRKKT